MVDTLFSLTSTREIGTSVRVTNAASKRVLEKCGFRQLGSSMETIAALRSREPCDRYVLDDKVWNSLKGWRMPVMDRVQQELTI